MHDEGETRMPIICLLAMIFCCGVQFAQAADGLKTIRIASKGSGEAIVTRGTVTTQVVVGGAVDYSNGGSIPAILGGAHLKIILINTDKPAQHLVVSSKIAQMKQLAGKSVAVSDAAGNSTLLLREMLSKNGVAVDTLQFRPLGEQTVRYSALLSGAVDATMLSYAIAKQAEAKGFRILAYSGDHVSSLSASLETIDDKIRNAPREVYSVVKATLKGQLFFHRNPNEAVKFIMELARINSPAEARDVWTERSKQASELARMGRASPEALMTNVERVRDQMKMAGAGARLKEKTTLDQVYDLSFAQKAYDDIQASKWDPMRYEYAKR
jgi:ABC-type nitrate/sulfonate/bicarbonate transport system substrate-binding protein